ncbi:phage baseplate assembly protein V [bacterium]|nr:phage baseplate assembly protein V [bacterium]
MSLEQELKSLVEKLAPDLRSHMRLSLSGVVTKVYEDDYRVDVEIPGDNDEVLSLPFIPVKSPMAMDGWGIFALPEVDSEVSVAFWGGDPTNPYVDGSVLIQSRTPVGAKVGMIVITDRVGQCIKLKPQTGEIIVNGYNLKTAVTGSEAKSVDGSVAETIGENRNVIVGRKATTTVKGKSVRVLEKGETAVHGVLDDAATFDDPEDENYLKLKSAATLAQVMGNHVQRVEGGQTVDIDGLQSVTVGSDRKTKVLGADFEAVAKSKQVLVGGNLDIMVANAMGVPMPAAIQIGSPPPMINCWGGIFIPGASAPMVNGTLLATAFTTYTTAITTALATLAGAFSGPNPVIGSQIAGALGTFATAVGLAVGALLSAITASLSLRQFFAVP